MNFKFSLSVGSNDFSSNTRWVKEVFKNKCFEFAIIRSKSSIVDVDFNVDTQKRSHQGASLIVILLSYGFELSFYDKRHWDYEKEQWNEV